MNNVNYRNIADLNSLILRKLSIVPRDFDLVVGLRESGLIPANLLSLYLNRPFTDLNSFLNGHIYKAGERGGFFTHNQNQKVLIVDDSLRTGTTLRKAKEKLAGLTDRFQFSYCVIYIEPGKEAEADLYLEHLTYPHYFQWHLLPDRIRDKVQFNLNHTPVYTELPEYPFLFAPNLIQAQAVFRKTGRPVLSLADFEMVSSSETVWKDLRSGKYMPGVRQFGIQLRNTIRRIIKKAKK